MKIETQLEFVPDHKVATVVFTKKNSKKELILMGIELETLETKMQKKELILMRFDLEPPLSIYTNISQSLPLVM